MSSDAPAVIGVIIILLIGLAATAFWIWAIVDVVKVPDDSMFKTGNKLVWVLVVVLAQVIGAIIYLVVGRPSSASRAARPAAPMDPSQPPPPPPGTVG